MQPAQDRPCVILVGLGNIGFRHLQGLAKIAPRIAVTAIDPAEAARERAAAEWLSVTGEKLAVAPNLDALPPVTAVAILATSASRRLQLVEELLEKTAPRDIVLEKVVFQKLEDFGIADAAARAAGARVSVNCPRRMWPLYETLQKKSFEQPELNIKWRNLGLACNSVHFIDALQFLAGSPSVQLEDAQLREIYSSKRDGYLEINGTMSFITPGGARLVIEVLADGPPNMAATLSSGGICYSLSEADGRLTAPDGTSIADVGRAPFQSELSGELVASLLDGSPSLLAPLAESRAAHEALFSALEPHLRSNGADLSAGLPIT